MWYFYNELIGRVRCSFYHYTFVWSYSQLA